MGWCLKKNPAETVSWTACGRRARTSPLPLPHPVALSLARPPLAAWFHRPPTAQRSRASSATPATATAATRGEANRAARAGARARVRPGAGAGIGSVSTMFPLMRQAVQLGVGVRMRRKIATPEDSGPR
eukprot:1194301-Prorocentrum_minimum.AAC.5